MKHKRIKYLLIMFICAFALAACGGGGGGGGGSTDESPIKLMGGATQGNTLALTGSVSTLAGLPLAVSSIESPWTSAQFSFSAGLTTDGINLYVADPISSTIRKVDITTGVVSTLAGNWAQTGSADGIGTLALFNKPSAITTDGTNLYVADTANCTVRKVVIATREVTTLAGSVPGSLTGISSLVDGTGAAATFASPSGITTDGINLYVADKGHGVIRKVVISTREVTTLAGNTSGGKGSRDGIGTAAFFELPVSITTDGTNLYVGDSYAHVIRKVVIATGEVTTLAGKAYMNGSSDGIGASALFYSPSDITTDGANLYVCDTYNDTIRKVVIATGTVTTLAGYAGSAGSADGTGATARLNFPMGITTDGTNIYVSDAGKIIIRKIVISTGAVTSLAVSTGGFGASDGTGSAARFITPNDITTDGTNLYVSDSGNDTIRKVVIASGAVTTLAGNAHVPSGSNDGIGTSALFNNPQGITTDGANLYICDADNNTIRKMVIATGVVSTLAGTPGTSGSTDGIGSAARFNGPFDLTTDRTNLYVTEIRNQTIRKVVIATGEVTTLAGTTGLVGLIDGIGANAHFNKPQGITTDGSNLFVADSNNNTIRKVAIATGEVTTFAGNPTVKSATDGTGTAAGFSNPVDITTDGKNLYVSDNNSIRKVVLSTGVVTTVAGSAGLNGSADAVGSLARFNHANGITTNGEKLFLTDCYNNTLRSIQ